MKCFAMLSIGNVGWIEKEKPSCGPLDAILRPLVLAPCTSDVHTVWEGAAGEKNNVVLGHECIGEVMEVGSLVVDFKPGDKVIVPAITPDWGSLQAQAGYAQHSGGMLGGYKFSGTKDGVFAEFFHVNEADANLAHLPSGVDPVDAVMITDMVVTGFHASDLANVGFGDTVCVIGIGPVGLMAVAGANLSGASHIYAVGSRSNCIEAAKFYGATDIINYKEGDIVKQVYEKTNGKGVDKVLIAGGDNDTFAQAIKILKPGGAIGSVSYLASGDYIKIPRLEWGLGMAHKSIMADLTPGGRLKMEKLVSLLETKKLDTSKLITHRFEGFEGIEPALMLMKNKSKDVIKPVVVIKY